MIMSAQIPPAHASAQPQSMQDPPALAPTTSQEQPPDRTFYTWTTQFKAMIGQATQSEIQSYNRAYDFAHAESIVRRAERNRDWLFQHSPVVRFLRDECSALGGEIGPHNVRCRVCTGKQRGGFDKEYGILVCANEDTTRKRMEETLAHEMVHAYDALRWKFNELNMKHAACTEIRASTLSGECRFTRQFLKQGNFKFVRLFQDCVRKHATLSVLARPQIKDSEHAESVVNSVWENCFNDTRPFDEIYR